MDAIEPDRTPIDDVEAEAAALRHRAHRMLRDDPGREARWARWQAENADSIAAYNRWFEREGHRYLNTNLL